MLINKLARVFSANYWQFFFKKWTRTYTWKEVTNVMQSDSNTEPFEERTWVGTFCIHRRRGVIKWPVHGIFRLSRRDAAKEKGNGDDVLLLNILIGASLLAVPPLTRHIVSVALYFFQGSIFRERDEARTRVSLIKRQIAEFNSLRNWWKRDDPYNERERVRERERDVEVGPRVL